MPLHFQVTTQLHFNFIQNNDDWFEFYCATCCENRADKVKFYREPGLTKMFGWDERLGYSCEGCGHVYFISNIDIYSGIKSGFIYTLQKLWHPAEVLIWQWMTDFFDGGDVWYPVDKEAFEKNCKKQIKESDEISCRIKEKYG